MTTTFELASTAASKYLPWNINQVGDPYSVYNSLSRSSSRKPESIHLLTAVNQDTADISATSALLAATESVTQADRIDSLRRNIANGTYAISAYRVAGSLIQSLA